MSLPKLLTPRLVKRYDNDGILTIPLPPSLRKLQSAYFQEVADWLKLVANISVSPNTIPETLPQIAAANRPLIAKLYKISRRFPSVKRMSVDPWLTKVSMQLMRTRLASACHFVNIRIDLPGEEKYLLPPHQDFPYIQGSLNALTWWIPFLDTSLEMGPPSWIPGSHRHGVQKVKYLDYEATGQSGGRSFEIVDLAQYRDNEYTRKPVRRGHALVFHTLLIHRSEHNHTDKARINIQIRFDDSTARESFDRNYPEGLYLGDAFSKSYPEYIA
ncbi:MAG: phytanoyl-CoA dioxygenase family protein [Acidimicrobiia bacterium]|nr:phytanoyl-CoA dioxygenase family protein [Acidimicrobiia bacterium]